MGETIAPSSISEKSVRPQMKVPGEVIPVGKMSHEVAKLRAELKMKNVNQLKEVLERQERILSNKRLVDKLPDKGERAKASRDAVKELLAERNKEEALASQMEKMNINPEKMEWKNRLLDSDDDSDPEYDGPVKDPLAVLTQGEVPKPRGKKDLEKRAVQHQEKVDHIEDKPKFVPFSSTKKTVLDDELKLRLGDGATSSGPPDSRPPTKHRTPSIPLPPVYSCQTRQISLSDSLSLQQERETKMRELQQRQAVERLTATRGLVKEEVKVTEFGSQYRDKLVDSEEEEEVSDEEGGQGVVGVQQLLDD